MAFKMESPICTCNTPIYERDLEQGVMGEANNNGSILINKDLSTKDKRQSEIKKNKLVSQGHKVKESINYLGVN